GEFLQFDTWNAEARLSLRALQPDPFHAFAERITVGRELRGHVTQLVPFGVFVQVADGIEGLIRRRDLTQPTDEVVQIGDRVTVVVTHVDREKRQLFLSRQTTGQL
ncbi:S1 RNA-binding domain-containing protein, partial [Nocardia sp. NPDC060220]|uniref:S1 RNA-binding domain-containing protein n=1 Tax=Nocardia sp. NPDC060220 TaxID=3347076 RepID=UPI0036627E76